MRSFVFMAIQLDWCKPVICFRVFLDWVSCRVCSYVLTLITDGMRSVRAFHFDKAAASVLTTCVSLAVSNPLKTYFTVYEYIRFQSSVLAHRHSHAPSISLLSDDDNGGRLFVLRLSSGQLTAAQVHRETSGNTNGRGQREWG